MKENNNKKELFIVGKRPVLEALRAQYPVRVVVFDRAKDHDAVMKNIFRLAKKQNVQILYRDESWFRRRFHQLNPQGVVGVGDVYSYVDLEDLKIKKNSIILILDRIQDPQNLGAIIRSAECAGVSGIIIPDRNAAEVNETVMSISSGAVFHMKVVRVPNLSRAVEYLKRKNVWIVGTVPNADKPYYEIDYKNVPFAVIIGNEGEGIREGLIKKCDYVVNIPMRGRVNSLNASVAAGIMVFRILEEKQKNNEY
jgi:23S rRNA (guanosine2251-2'-O)-methyltransferase